LLAFINKSNLEKVYMGKLEAIIKYEIVRLAKMEMRKISVPLKREVFQLKRALSQLRKTVLALEGVTARQQKELGEGKVTLEASPEEVTMARFSPRLFRSLRKHLGITQKELSILCGVSVGAVQSWESGKFRPKDEMKIVLVALRKINRRDVRKLLDERGTK
jgi:DNA-binding transcriptional regulator YiaG